MTVLHAENDLQRESFFLQNQKAGQQGVDPLPTAEVQAGVEGGRWAGHLPILAGRV